MFSVRII